MEVAASRPTRLLPLRIVAALLFLAKSVALTKIVTDRHELLAAYPGLNQKLLATMIAVTFIGAVALVFLGFFRQRFGLWIVLACAAVELAIETWAGFPPVYLLRIPIAAVLVFFTAQRAWPELRGLK
jgi:hypothetical protein